ncbi:MAG: rod shape-determining protein [Dorea sp.]|jgi:MreB/Mrl family cell shape determining protein|nr:rod shape-determining protein [Dorea sp.]
MAKNTYGLDLGSYEIKVYDKKKDRIWKAKDAIAIMNGKEIFAIGDEAYVMYEKTPVNIEVVFPMKSGVISKFNNMQFLMQGLLKREHQSGRGCEYVIAVPTDVTEVEKKAFFDLVIHSTARAKEVNIVERAIADAIGMDLDVKNTKGLLVVNFGGETTEVSVLAGGGMIFNKLMKVGGVDYDSSIASLVRFSHDFMIGRLTAEALRKRFGVYTGEAEDTAVMVAGRDLITGLPIRKPITLSLVRSALRDPLLDCVRAVLSLIDRTPPEVRAAIHDNGIFLTGGLANMPGLETYIEKATGIATKTAPNPELCTIDGLKKIILSNELSRFAYSMLDEKYRWMR